MWAAASAVTSGRRRSCSASRCARYAIPPARLLLAALHGAADGLRVERGHGEQRPVHVAVGREVHAAGADPVAQVLARVRVGDRSDDPVEAASLQQVLGDRVEQPGARPEDQVDGGAGDAGRPRDLLDADRLRRRRTQPLVDRVEDPPAGLLRRLRPQPLLVLPGAPSSAILHFG